MESWQIFFTLYVWKELFLGESIAYYLCLFDILFAGFTHITMQNKAFNCQLSIPTFKEPWWLISFSVLVVSPQYSTYRDKLRPYSWVGTTLLKRKLIWIVPFLTYFRHVYWHLRVFTSKQKLKPGKSWRKYSALRVLFWSPIFASEYMFLY